MIVKIFNPIASFAGVSYNTRKIDRDKGELMTVANFGPLQAFGHLKPRDYINYFEAVSALNKNVKLPQFHAVISAKGRNYSKNALTGIAESWLKEMGYGDQPYLVVYHKDTGNNHVHMVTTRVRRDGEKVNSAYERVRAQKNMRKVLGYDFAMQYRFSTRAQFMMVLESRGFSGTDPDESGIRQKIEKYVPDKKRAEYIAGLLKAHKTMPGLTAYMKDKYQIELLFHSSEGKKPYGYSIIDHETKQVFKGSDVLPLKVLTDLSQDTNETGIAKERSSEAVTEPAVHIQSISIADDVDDQQIHGMRRRRQKKARTNTR